MILTPLPPPGPSRTARLKELLQLLAVAGGILAAVIGTSMAWVGSLATDTEVQTAVTAHNLALDAHPRGALQAEEQSRAIAELQQSRQQTNELWYTLVGLGCSDRETDNRLKAAAAAYCRDDFQDRVAKGSDAARAYRDVLRLPWYTRPRVR